MIASAQAGFPLLQRLSGPFSLRRRDASAQTHSVGYSPRKEGRSDAGSPTMRTKVQQPLGCLTCTLRRAYTSELPAPSSLRCLGPGQGSGTPPSPREKRAYPPIPSFAHHSIQLAI